MPWGVKERLVLEKTAIGFYLSGHLFDEVETEVRQFAKRKIGDLIDSRDQQVLAAIVSDLRVINGNRGKLRSSSSTTRPSARGLGGRRPFNANRNLLKDDELVIVQGTLQAHHERFGRRFKVTQVWDLETARCRFGKYLRVAVNGRRRTSRGWCGTSRRAAMSDQGEIWCRACRSFNGARWRAGRAATRGARQVLPDRCRACELDGAGRSRQSFGRLRMRG
jgi:DNA polymerase-3 subunit alpha